MKWNRSQNGNGRPQGKSGWAYLEIKAVSVESDLMLRVLSKDDIGAEEDAVGVDEDEDDSGEAVDSGEAER